MTIPNKGARVSELSIQDMGALSAVRITLESEAVRTARPLSADEAKALRSILNDIQVALDASDRPEACACTVSSILLYERRESGWLPYWADILWKHAERHRGASLPFRLDGTNSEPREVMAALEKGHNEEATRTLRRHPETTAWQSRSPLAPFQKVGWPTPKSSQRKCGRVGEH